MNGLVKVARSKTRLKKLRVDVDIIKQRKKAYGDNFEDIKQALNNIYYEIFKVIQNETLSIIRREKKIKTTLQFLRRPTTVLNHHNHEHPFYLLDF